MRKQHLVAYIFTLAGVVALMAAGTAVAQTAQQVQDGVNSIGGENSPSLTTSVETGVNVFLFLIGAVAVVMIIYGGFRYVTSAGDSSAITSAKNVILYSVVGLVVAISAYAIASFVTGTLGGPTEAECTRIFDEEGRVADGC